MFRLIFILFVSLTLSACSLWPERMSPELQNELIKDDPEIVDNPSDVLKGKKSAKLEEEVIEDYDAELDGPETFDFKNGMYKTTQACPVFAQPNTNSKAVGKTKKNRKIWADRHNGSWGKIYRKAGPAYIEAACLLGHTTAKVAAPVPAPRKPASLKSGFHVIKKGCTYYGEANDQSDALAKNDKNRRVWADVHDDEWLKVYRKAGPAYIEASCVKQ